jgi:hypothetical protein
MRTIFARLDNDARRVVKDDEEEEEEVLEQDDRRTLVVVSYARDAARDVSMCASRCVARVRMVQLSNTISRSLAERGARRRRYIGHVEWNDASQLCDFAAI